MTDWAAWRLHREIEQRLRITVSQANREELLAMDNPSDVTAGELFHFACRRLGSGFGGYDPDPTRRLQAGTRCAVCKADVADLAAGMSCPACGTSMPDSRQIWGHMIASVVAATGAAPKSVRKSTLLGRDLGMSL